jgi:hypothetical protein
MKSWRYQLAMSPPLLTSADQQAITQPGLKEPVFVRFINVHVAAKNQFDITRIRNEDNKLVANPSTNDVAKMFFDFHAFAEDF